MTHHRLALTLIGIGISVGSGVLQAGSLNPSNAPAPTMHTLEDVYRVLSDTTAETKIGLNNTNLPTATMHTIEEIYQLAVIVKTNTVAGVRKTGVTTSYATGDDGYYQKGISWPNPLFTTGSGTSSNCVTDNRTGLMWVRNPSETARNWGDALSYCEALDGNNGRGGYTDWRMPNVNELMTLWDYGQNPVTMPAGHPFLGAAVAEYAWTSTSVPWSPSTLCWVINTSESLVTFYTGKSGSNYVWAVRGGN